MLRKNLLLILSFLAVTLSNFSAFAQDDVRSVTVLASSSLTNVITELARVYSTKEQITISSVYNSPEELANSIESGEPADIFISEHPILMRDLKRQGLLDVFTITTLSRNRLVLVAAQSNVLSKDDPTTDLKSLLKNVNERTLLVMADPRSAYIGKTIKSAITKLASWDRIVPAIVRAANTRNALYLIAKGRKAGFVYYSDAFNNKEVKIVSEFPRDSYDPIVYQAAVVAGAGENMTHARKFLQFLKSNQARDVFIKHGFTYM